MQELIAMTKDCTICGSALMPDSTACSNCGWFPLFFSQKPNDSVLAYIKEQENSLKLLHNGLENELSKLKYEIQNIRAKIKKSEQEKNQLKSALFDLDNEKVVENETIKILNEIKEGGIGRTSKANFANELKYSIYETHIEFEWVDQIRPNVEICICYYASRYNEFFKAIDADFIQLIKSDKGKKHFQCDRISPENYGSVAVRLFKKTDLETIKLSHEYDVP
jgi:hypothetical protein